VVLNPLPCCWTCISSCLDSTPEGVCTIACGVVPCMAATPTALHTPLAWVLARARQHPHSSMPDCLPAGAGRCWAHQHVAGLICAPAPLGRVRAGLARVVRRTSRVRPAAPIPRPCPSRSHVCGQVVLDHTAWEVSSVLAARGSASGSWVAALYRMYTQAVRVCRGRAALCAACPARVGVALPGLLPCRRGCASVGMECQWGCAAPITNMHSVSPARALGHAVGGRPGSEASPAAGTCPAAEVLWPAARALHPPHHKHT
jgi:hypothetical protein